MKSHLLRHRIIRYATAAAAVLVIGLGLFFMYNNQTATPTDNQVTNNITPAEIPAATAKATLTLADNTTLVLDGADNDTIARQGSFILHSKNGQLIYTKQASSTASIPGGFYGYHTVTSPKGGFYRMALPDGTGVWLNAASSLKYPADFSGDERIVELTGEGYFEVAKSYVTGTTRRQPFLVKTPAGTIEVLGTKFNVQAYSDMTGEITTLLEGSVRITPQQDEKMHRQLSPGQQAVLGGKQIKVRAGDSEAAIAWINGWFSFENAGVTEVMRQLSRWYDVSIEYRSAIPVAASVNGLIDRTIPLSELLVRLQKTIGQNLDFKLQGKTIVVSVKN